MRQPLSPVVVLVLVLVLVRVAVALVVVVAVVVVVVVAVAGDVVEWWSDAMGRRLHVELASQFRCGSQSSC